MSIFLKSISVLRRYLLSIKYRKICKIELLPSIEIYNLLKSLFYNFLHTFFNKSEKKCVLDATKTGI